MNMDEGCEFRRASGRARRPGLSKDPGAMRVQALAILAAILLSGTADADTKLLGLDVSEAEPSCWVSARSLNHWKMAKYQAVASGTIAYFKIHVPADTSVEGCTHDRICWAIYEGDTGDVPTALKAYGCDTDYDWTVLGAGTYHMFPPTDVVTDLSVAEGGIYWLTHYSYALHESLWANAGCSAQVLSHRGNNEPCEQPLYKRVCSDGNCDDGFACNSEPGEFPPPPDASCFETDIASFYDLSVWSGGDCGNHICESGETPETCPADCTGPDTCPNGTCEAGSGENCSTCPQDCLDAATEVCCGGEVFSGECCTAGDCGADESCTDHLCVPAGEEIQDEGEEAVEEQVDAPTDAPVDGGPDDAGGGESGCGCGMVR